MKRIPIGDVDEQLLELMDPHDDEGLVITKRGVPVARIVPRIVEKKGKFAKYIGSMKDEITVHGDIFSTGVHYPEDCHKYNRDEDQP